MTLDADYLVDRSRLKRRLTFWRVSAIVVLVALIATAIGRFTGTASRAHIARLSIERVIVDDPDRLAAIRDAMDDTDIKAVIVRINSPGGTVVGGEALHKALVKLATKKPVVAAMGSLATSAGYMIAVPAHHIVAHEGTITGSIGVLFQTAEITDLLNKLGIAVESITSGPLKAEPSPFKKLSPAVKRATQMLVDDMFDMFVDMVAQHRKMSADRVRSLADGRVFTGRMAVQNGLIDAIGGEDAAVRWLEENKELENNLPVRDLRIRRPVPDWFDHIASLTRKTVFSERLTLDGLVAVWHPQLQ
jgi:protease-4